MCSKCFFTAGLVQEHLRSHTNEKPWKCSLCKFEAKSERTLERHEEARHGRLKRINLHRCMQCDFTTRFRSWLDCHLISHSQDRPHACTVPGCSFRAKTTKTLTKHAATHGSVQIPCAVIGCTYLAKNAGVLQYHNLKKHSSPFPCVFPECKARFNTEAALISHQSFHDPGRPHQCNSCLHRFNKTFQLNKHILHTHEKPQRFQCPLCDYSTSGRYNRKTHMKKFHRMQDIFCISQPGCNFRSCSVEDLDQHRRTRHSISRPFKCEYCPYRFGHSSGLRIHLTRKHKGSFQQKVTTRRGHVNRLSGETCDCTFQHQISKLNHSTLHKVAIILLTRIKICLP